MVTRAATTTTSRNRKLECGDCGYTARASRAMMRRGFPGCPCGGRLLPWDLDDVLEFLDGDDLEAHPVYRAYMAEASSVAHGQAWAGGMTREFRTGRRMRDPSLVAFERVELAQRESARRRRLTAIASPEPELGF